MILCVFMLLLDREDAASRINVMVGWVGKSLVVSAMATRVFVRRRHKQGRAGLFDL